MHPAEKTAWFTALAHEAKRDLVFAWNIGRGSFVDIKEAEEVLPGLFVEAAEHLLAEGCKVGFGDPDSDDWRDLPTLSMANDERAKFVAEMWESNRQEYEFLVFAIRA
jgi:hypothetical protein